MDLARSIRNARTRWTRPVGLGVALCLLVAIAILVLSFDNPQTGARDPQTANAYVGGDTTPLSARVTGYLREFPVADNQVVQAGQLVAGIEDDDYRAQAAGAAAALDAAEARLTALDAQLRQLAEQTAEARTGEVAASADAGRAAPELRRQVRLLHTDLGQQRNLDQAQADQRRYEAGIAQARALTGVAQRQTDELAAQRDEQAATVLGRRADLRLARITLGWTRLSAPVAGTLGPRLVRQGDLLAPGTRLVVLTPLDSVWVDANFTERQIPDIRIGQRARLVLDAFPRQPLEGRVTGLSPTTGSALSAIPADNTTGNFTKVAQRVPVRIAILWNGSPLRGLVRPGMSVTATVFTREGS
ncbi:HlyD family secretion protein [Lichenicoccus sp.]|uniref:HlyD family secretion protein n=1 Tax=Lichenicoccus sp. TaxID=2781899 RepID=UPI003D13D8AD